MYLEETSEHIAFVSAVLPSSPGVLGKRLCNLLFIKEYAIPSCISCAISENNARDSTSTSDVGLIRRVTMNYDPFKECVLREKFCKLDSNNFETILEYEYVPCGKDEIASRCPFHKMRNVNKSSINNLLNVMLTAAHTSYSVCTLSHNENKCFVELKTKLHITSKLHNDVLTKTEAIKIYEEKVIHDIVLFWQRYLQCQLTALEQFIIREAYPLLSSRIENEFKNSYEDAEDTLCRWTVSMEAAIKRNINACAEKGLKNQTETSEYLCNELPSYHAILKRFDQNLVEWGKVLTAYKAEKLANVTLSANIDGSKRVAEEAARQLAQQQSQLTELQQQNTELSHEVIANSRYYCDLHTQSTNQSSEKAQMPSVNKGNMNIYEPAQDKNVNDTGIVANPLRGKAEGQSNTTLVRLPEPKLNAQLIAKLFEPQMQSSNTSNNVNNQEWWNTHFTFNEDIAETIFNLLISNADDHDKNSNDGIEVENKHYVTPEKLYKMLMTIDHCGLYEQAYCAKNNTSCENNEPELYRAMIKQWYCDECRKHESIADDEYKNTGNQQQCEVQPDFAYSEFECKKEKPDAHENLSYSALTKMIERHERYAAERKATAIKQLATRLVKEFSFREPLRLYFDEFCLALIHLMKP